MALGTAIKCIRKEKRVLQKDLAKQCGISITALVQIENNNSFPKEVTLLKIRESLGVSMSYIFFCALDESDVSDDKIVFFRTCVNFLKPMLSDPSLNCNWNEAYKWN